MADLYGEPNDGWCASAAGSWNTVRDGAGAGVDSNNHFDADAISVTYYARRGTYAIKRAFFEFDTSGISIAPSAGTLKVFGRGSNVLADIIAVRSEQGGTLAEGDFNSFPSAAVTALGNSDGSGAGTFAGISGLTYAPAVALWSASDYNNFTLNATALADMASLDTFKVCLMNYDYDYLDIDGSTTRVMGVTWQERSGTSQDPYIVYTAGVAVTDNATFFGANF